jgi:hypothetical protein
LLTTTSHSVNISNLGGDSLSTSKPWFSAIRVPSFLPSPYITLGGLLFPRRLRASSLCRKVSVGKAKTSWQEQNLLRPHESLLAQIPA